MSFLKITDPSKRAAIVDEYLKLKKSIQQNSLSEKLGDSDLQRDLIKLYKPITESQAGITKELSDTSTALKALPATISSSLQAIMPAFSEAIEYPSSEEDPIESIRRLEHGDLATEYLSEYGQKDKTVVDTTFGIYKPKNNRQIHIGTLPISILNDAVTVGEKTYTGTPGLWELLTMKKPSNYSSDDLENYANILVKTQAMQSESNPNKVRSSGGYKYNNIIKILWDKTEKGTTYIEPGAFKSLVLPTFESTDEADAKPKTKGKTKVPASGTKGKASIAFGTKVPADIASAGTTGKAGKAPGTTGEGVTASIILPSNPNALVERLKLLIDAYNADNTGVADEAIAICDTLLNQGVLNKETYKVYITGLNRL